VGASEKTLRLIVDGIAGSLAIMTAEGQVSSSTIKLWIFRQDSRRIERLGYQRSRPSDDLPQAVAAWRRSVETGDPYDVDHRLRRADGVYAGFTRVA